MGGDASGHALRVQSRLPHFVSLNDDLLASEIIIYTLREGLTTFGADNSDAEKRPDVILEGPGLVRLGLSCIISHTVGMDTAHGYLKEIISLTPVEGARITVDDIQITEPTILFQGVVVQPK